MFHQVQAYSGAVVGNLALDDDAIKADTPVNQPQTAQEIIEHANEQANEIIETARLNAAEESTAAIEQAKQEAEMKIAEQVTNALVNLRLELWSSKVAMGEILIQALEAVVGKVGKDKMALMAIEQATKEYCNDKSVTVLASKKTIDRLKLVAIGAGKDLSNLGIHLALDPGISDGRCVLKNGDTKIEVGLDAQVAALKAVFQSDAIRALKDAQSTLLTTGKLK